MKVVRVATRLGSERVAGLKTDYKFGLTRQPAGQPPTDESMPSALSPAAGASKSSAPARYPEAAVLPVFAQSGRNKPQAPARRELRSEHRGLQIAYFSMGYGDSPASNSAGFYQILPAVPQPGQSRKRIAAVTFGIRRQQLPDSEAAELK